MKESPEMEKIRKAVKAASLYVVLGYSERDRSSIYIAQVCHETARFWFLGVVGSLQKLGRTSHSHS